MSKVTFLSVVLLIVGCCGDSNPPKKTNTDYGVVSTSGSYCYDGKKEMTLEFQADEDAIYLIEGWFNPHRAPNKLLNEYFINCKSGFKQTLSFNPSVYRIDVIKITDKVERTVHIIPENQGSN
jgi:hypothetical protein